MVQSGPRRRSSPSPTTCADRPEDPLRRPLPVRAKAVCTSYPLTIRGKPIPCGDVPKLYTKVVLAVNLPDGDPIVYLRSRHRKST